LQNEVLCEGCCAAKLVQFQGASRAGVGWPDGDVALGCSESRHLPLGARRGDGGKKGLAMDVRNSG